MQIGIINYGKNYKRPPKLWVIFKFIKFLNTYKTCEKPTNYPNHLENSLIDLADAGTWTLFFYYQDMITET